MKIIMIDCNAEEIRANRTLFNSITDAVSSFVSNMNNAGITPEMLAALHEDEEEAKDEGTGADNEA